MTENNNTWFEGVELKEKELTKIFENIKEELALITASAKFNFAIQKTNEDSLKIVLAYIEDTKKLAELLKTRMTLLSKATS